jgi:hypothetical protein
LGDRALVVLEGVEAVDSEEAVLEALLTLEVSKEVPEVSGPVPEVPEAVLEAVEAVPEVLGAGTVAAPVLEAVEVLEVSEAVPEVDTAVEPAPEALAVEVVVDRQVQWCQFCAMKMKTMAMVATRSGELHATSTENNVRFRPLKLTHRALSLDILRTEKILSFSSDSNACSTHPYIQYFKIPFLSHRNNPDFITKTSIFMLFKKTTDLKF